MDLKLTNYDLDITNGELSFVEGTDAVRQDIEMALRTWLEETPYDRNAGVPYIQVIFKRGTTLDAIRFIIEQVILGRDNVTEVLELSTELDTATREITISGRVRAFDAEVEFTAGSPFPPGPFTPPSENLATWFDLRRRRFTTDVGIDAITDEGSLDTSYTQATGAAQPAEVLSLGKANIVAARFDGVDDYVASGISEADSAFLHDGTDFSIALVISDDANADGPIFSTCDGAATDIGIDFRRVGGDLRLRICNGTATFEYDMSAAVTVGDKIIVIRHGSGTIDVQIDGVDVAGLGGTTFGTPSAADSDAPIAIGTDAAAMATFWAGAIGWWAAYDRLLTNTERSNLFSNLGSEYKIP